MDSRIDALSSGINGTMVAVCAEDDDRVTEGELLVEIDPRDYEVAVEQAKARLELALAQVASTRQVMTPRSQMSRGRRDQLQSAARRQALHLAFQASGSRSGSVRSIYVDRPRRCGQS